MGSTLSSQMVWRKWYWHHIYLVEHGAAWLSSKICHAKDFGKPKVGQKNYHRFDKPNMRGCQVFVANQILAKIMSCQIFDMAIFERTNQAHITK